jgi:DNA binding protein S1FA
MTNNKNRKNRSKLKVILLAPALIFTFIIGWSLYCLGQQNDKPTKQKPTNKTPVKEENLELMVIPQEKEILAK